MTKHYQHILALSGLMFLSAVSQGYAQVNDHAVVRDTENQIVHSTNGNCVRTKWENDHDSCARPSTALLIAAPATAMVRKPMKAAELTQEDRTVYFEFNHHNLTTASVDRLATLDNILKTDQSVKEARIVGYADRIGSVVYNEKLSQKRAETVRDYLVANGYTNARVTETRWVGEAEPSTTCPASLKRTKLIACLQADRRVEIEIGLVSDEHASNTP